jgi:hypothetical protein
VGIIKGPRLNWAEGGFYLCLAGAAGLLALLAMGNGQWSLALVVLAAAGGWGGGHWLGRRWLSPLTFVVLIGCAVAGLWRNLPAAWLVASVAIALAAWDLNGFAARLARYEQRPDETRLVKNHVGRLLGVTGLGVILGEVALTLRLALGLGGLALVGLLAFIILLQGMRLLGGDSEEQVKKSDV